LGAMLVGFGLLQFASVLRKVALDERSRSIARAAGILSIAAQAGYVIVGIYHMFASPMSIAEGDSIFITEFWVYVIALLLALAGFAVLLMRIKLRRWMAVLLTVLVTLHFLQLVLTGTFLPVTVYLLLLPIGIALVARPMGQRGEAVAAAPAPAL